MHQHDAADERGRRDAAVRAGGAARGAEAHAGPHGRPRGGEQLDAPAAEPEAVGRRAPARRDRDAGLRRELDLQHRGQRAQSREHHLTRNWAACGARQREARADTSLFARAIGERPSPFYSHLSEYTLNSKERQSDR